MEEWDRGLRIFLAFANRTKIVCDVKIDVLGFREKVFVKICLVSALLNLAFLSFICAKQLTVLNYCGGRLGSKERFS